MHLSNVPRPSCGPTSTPMDSSSAFASITSTAVGVRPNAIQNSRPSSTVQQQAWQQQDRKIQHLPFRRPFIAYKRRENFRGKYDHRAPVGNPWNTFGRQDQFVTAPFDEDPVTEILLICHYRSSLSAARRSRQAANLRYNRTPWRINQTTSSASSTAIKTIRTMSSIINQNVESFAIIRKPNLSPRFEH